MAKAVNRRQETISVNEKKNRNPRTVRERRTYNFEIELPGVSRTSGDAKAFHSKSESILQKGRTIHRFDFPQDASNCLIVGRVECPSCGPSSLARFTRSLKLAFPSVVVVQVSKERK